MINYMTDTLSLIIIYRHYIGFTYTNVQFVMIERIPFGRMAILPNWSMALWKPCSLRCPYTHAMSYSYNIELTFVTWANVATCKLPLPITGLRKQLAVLHLLPS